MAIMASTGMLIGVVGALLRDPAHGQSWQEDDLNFSQGLGHRHRQGLDDDGVTHRQLCRPVLDHQLS